MKPHVYYNGMHHLAGTPLTGGLIPPLLIILAVAAALGLSMKSLSARAR